MGRAAHLMTQEVTVAVLSSINAGGTKTYGAQSTVDCRIENDVRIVRDQSGEERVTQTKLVSETEIDLSARVWLPGADTNEANEAMRVITARSAQTPDGYALYETWL